MSAKYEAHNRRMGGCQTHAIGGGGGSHSRMSLISRQSNRPVISSFMAGGGGHTAKVNQTTIHSKQLAKVYKESYLQKYQPGIGHTYMIKYLVLG